MPINRIMRARHPPPRPARRAFLIGAATSLLMPDALVPALAVEDGSSDARERAVKLLASCTAIDMHSHVGGSRSEYPKNDFATIRAGGVAAACMALVSDGPVIRTSGGHIAAFRKPRNGELYANMQERLDFADRAIATFDLRRITSVAELRASKAEGAAGIILATEGSDFIDGQLERLQTVHERGVRHVQLVHYRADNGAGDIQTEEPLYQGATPLGLDIVRTCNRLGMVVDVAHATYDTVLQVARVSSTPLILSHTALAATPGPRSRHVSGAHARLVADTGGVVGVWTNGSDFSGYPAFARGIARMTEAIGIDHVGIGSDLNGLVRPMPFGYATYPEMVIELSKYFNDEELAKILGGNYVRVFERATTAPVS